MNGRFSGAQQLGRALMLPIAVLPLPFYQMLRQMRQPRSGAAWGQKYRIKVVFIRYLTTVVSNQAAQKFQDNLSAQKRS